MEKLSSEKLRPGQRGAYFFDTGNEEEEREGGNRHTNTSNNIQLDSLIVAKNRGVRNSWPELF